MYGLAFNFRVGVFRCNGLVADVALDLFLRFGFDHGNRSLSHLINRSDCRWNFDGVDDEDV
jgi:hypothetical protein